MVKLGVLCNFGTLPDVAWRDWKWKRFPHNERARACRLSLQQIASPLIILYNPIYAATHNALEFCNPQLFLKLDQLCKWWYYAPSVLQSSGLFNIGFCCRSLLEALFRYRTIRRMFCWNSSAGCHIRRVFTWQSVAVHDGGVCSNLEENLDFPPFLGTSDTVREWLPLLAARSIAWIYFPASFFRPTQIRCLPAFPHSPGSWNKQFLNAHWIS